MKIQDLKKPFVEIGNKEIFILQPQDLLYPNLYLIKTDNKIPVIILSESGSSKNLVDANARQAYTDQIINLFVIPTQVLVYRVPSKEEINKYPELREEINKLTK